MRLAQAVKQLEKVVGKNVYKHITVSIMKHSKEPDVEIEWALQSGNTPGVFSAPTFKEALKEIKTALRPKKKQGQDVEVKI